MAAHELACRDAIYRVWDIYGNTQIKYDKCLTGHDITCHYQRNVEYNIGHNPL